MDYILVILVAIIFQVVFNVISTKIEYDYSKSFKWIAIIINIVVWLLLFEKLDWSITFFLLATASTVLIASSFIDFSYQEIPNSYNVLVALLGVGFIIRYKDYALDLLTGAIIVFILFLAIMMFTGAMGGGDVKMAGAIGLFLGTGFIAQFITISFFLGAFVAIGLILLKKKGKQDVFPFGPYIAIAGMYLFIFNV